MTAADDDRYLDGLAGRGPAGAGDTAHAEGMKLRQALLDADQPAARPPQPDWSEVLRRETANDAGPQRRWPAALAAGVLCSFTLGWFLWPQPDTEWRGGAGAGQAVWVSASPKDDAQRLAQELRQLGAQVTLRETGSGAWKLAISASATQAAAVNASLSRLDSALGADGRLELTVRAAAPR